MAEAGGAGPGNNRGTRRIRFAASKERPFHFQNEPVRARAGNSNTYVNTAQGGREYPVQWSELQPGLLQHVITPQEAAKLAAGAGLEVLPPKISSARLGGRGLRGLAPVYPSYMINKKTNRRSELSGPTFQQTNEEKRLTKQSRENRRQGYAYTRENQMENLKIAQRIRAAEIAGDDRLRQNLLEELQKRRKGIGLRAREIAELNRLAAEQVLAEPVEAGAGGGGGGGAAGGIAMVAPGRIRPSAAGTVRRQPLVVPPASLLNAPVQSALKGTRKALANRAAENKAAANKAAANKAAAIRAAAEEEAKKQQAMAEVAKRRQLPPLPAAAQAKARPTLASLPGGGVTARAVLTEEGSDSLSSLLAAGGGAPRRAGLLPPMGAAAGGGAAVAPSSFLVPPTGQPVPRLPYAPAVGASAATGVLAPLRSTLASAGATLFKPGKPLGGGKRKRTRKVTKRRRGRGKSRKN